MQETEKDYNESTYNQILKKEQRIIDRETHRQIWFYYEDTGKSINLIRDSKSHNHLQYYRSAYDASGTQEWLYRVNEFQKKAEQEYNQIQNPGYRNY